MKRLILLFAGISMLCASAVRAGVFDFEFEELQPGIWAGIRPDSPRFPVMGNTAFIVSQSGVVVFDGGGVPAMADQVIEKIREETGLPVTHVVISHWHGDHHFGIYRYLEAFPNVQVVAHEFTFAAINGSPIDYMLSYPDYVANNRPRLQEMVDTGKYPDGKPIPQLAVATYRRTLQDMDEIDAQYKAVRITQPSITFNDRLVIHSGTVTIELLSLGHGNTEGDIVMWLPGSGLVAAGDLVVAPTPYAFNVPPRAWARSLRKLKDLDFQVLVPGHGAVQHDAAYVDLLIESAESIADQRDRLIEQGLGLEEVEQQLDFSTFEQRFTRGDKYLTRYYQSWFEQPFRKAAIKALGDEPMVGMGPRKNSTQ